MTTHEVLDRADALDEVYRDEAAARRTEIVELVEELLEDAQVVMVLSTSNLPDDKKYPALQIARRGMKARKAALLSVVERALR